MKAQVELPCSEPILKTDADTPKVEVESTGRREVHPAGQNLPVAVIICHGMGQQAPFETLNGACELLERGGNGENADLTDKPPWSWDVQSSNDQYVKLDEMYLPRSVLTFKEKDTGERREVHVYESYWAPLAEGAITLPETMSFLFGSAGIGIWHCVRSPKGFHRWLFGGKKFLAFTGNTPSLPLSMVLTLIALAGAAVSLLTPNPNPGFVSMWWIAGMGAILFLLLGVNRTTRHLTAAALVFGSLVSMNTIAGMIAAQRFGIGSIARKIDDRVVDALTGDLALGLIAIALCSLVGFVVPSVYRNRVGKQVPKALRGITRLFAWLALSLLAGLGGLMALRLVSDAPTFFTVRKELIWLLWGVVILLSAMVRRFLLQFMGDVAIYASSHTVNRFSKVRQEIRDVGRKVFHSVYAAADDNNQPRYRDVLVVGHSLGSVVAYDSWNSVMNEDLLKNRQLRVAERSPLFLTFGSPLDKFAFLFRNQMAQWFEHREALSASVQPAIVNVDRRPQHWVNVWSADDWISGDLGYYDDPPPGPADTNESPSWSPEYGVINLEDPEACTPGVSHNEYWQNTLLPRILFSAVISTRELKDELVRQGSHKP